MLIPALLAIASARAQSCLDPWLFGDVIPHSATGIGSAVAWDPDGGGPLTERLVVSDFLSIPAAPDCDKVAWWDGKMWQPLGHPATPPRPLAVIAGELHGADMRWDGTSWQKLGAGLYGVIALAEWQGFPVAAARTSSNANTISIFRWNGTDWESLALTNASPSSLVALVEYDGDLIAVGNWTTIAGQAIQGVARFDGETWSPIGAGLASGSAQCAAVVNNSLYVGGSFNLSSPAIACSVAKWDGAAWTKYGPTGISPRCIAERSGLPVVLAPPCGDGCSSSVDAVFTLQSGQWKAVAADGPKGDVRALVKFDGDLVTVGQFASMAIGPTLGGKADIGVLSGQNWMPLSRGFNSSILASLNLGSDQLVLAGSFTQAPNQSASRIARWDGTALSEFGLGFNQAVAALVEYNGQIHAGGGFTKSGNSNVLYVASWNGTAWQSVGNSGFDGSVNYLAAGSDRLYASGSFAHAGGLFVNGMAQLVNGNWYSIAGRISGGGRIVTHQDSLYVAGAVVTTSGTMNGIAKWDGTSWSSISPQATGTIAEMYSDGESLWISGAFKVTPGDPTSDVARWNGVTWQSFFVGTSSGRFLKHNGVLYLVDRGAIRRWDGTSWTVVALRPNNGVSDFVNCVASFGGEIVVAGSVRPAGLEPTVFDPLFDRWNADGVPGFLVQPQPITIGIGQVAVMAVKIAEGYEPLGGSHLRWRKNSEPLSDGPTASGSFLTGTDSPTLLINFTSSSDSGFYDCVVSTDCGERVSESARLLAGPPCPADFNNDGFVDDSDFTIFVFAYDILECEAPEMPMGCPADLNGDGFVEDADFSLFVVKYDQLICP